jgi:hypothetical protein
MAESSTQIWNILTGFAMAAGLHEKLHGYLCSSAQIPVQRRAFLFPAARDWHPFFPPILLPYSHSIPVGGSARGRRRQRHEIC